MDDVANCSSEDVTQGLVNPRISRRQAPADHTQNIARRENNVPGGIGVNDTACGIDKADARA